MMASSVGSALTLPGAQFDTHRVDEFLQKFDERTRKIGRAQRQRELDKRLHQAALSVADKVEVFRRLTPPRDRTGGREELRMTRLLLSITAADLPWFKAALEYDGDYKDMVEYLFHDIDETAYRNAILKHFRTVAHQGGIKVLSDVDDTMYANLLEERYPKKLVYPGVIEFYDALKREPFPMSCTPLTTLSARPNPIGGALEEASLKGLGKLSEGKLCPSALSGSVVSTAVGTAETVLRAELEALSDEVPHGQEEKIGKVKFANLVQFSQVYPEYRYVFVGDSGQADAVTAQAMLAERATLGASRVITTFLHDLRQAENDRRAASPAFKKLPPHLVVTPTSRSGRGVIVFRNYIEAAVIAHTHAATLDNLVTAESLARITKAALTALVAHEDAFHQAGKEESRKKLREQYRQDAEKALHLLAAATPQSDALANDVMAIRRILETQFAK